MGLIGRFLKILDSLNLPEEERKHWIELWDELNIKYGSWCYNIILEKLRQKYKELRI